MAETITVEHWDEARWGGPPTAENMRKKLEAEGYSVSQYTYPPGARGDSPLRSSRSDGRVCACVCCTGTYFAPHTHKVEKKDAVVSGRFKMTMFGNTFVLEAGDCLLVPSASLPHYLSFTLLSVLAGLTAHRSPPELSTPPRWWAMSLSCP
jgi:mannose-6-phosphate isomerase-like protein (cupin superfamily)